MSALHNPGGHPAAAGDGAPGWVRLGAWWVSRAGLDAVADRLQARRLLTDPVVFVVLRKTYQHEHTPTQIAAWFATTFPSIVPLAEEGFIRYVLAAVERPHRPHRPEPPPQPEGPQDTETGERP